MRSNTATVVLFVLLVGGAVGLKSCSLYMRGYFLGAGAAAGIER
jgi:hypothetical protein